MRAAEPVDALEILQVERHERGGAAGCLDLVVELFEPADGARDRDDMGAGRGEALGGVVADPARGAGDDGDPAFKRLALAHAVSARRLRCRISPAPSLSVSRVG